MKLRSQYRRILAGLFSMVFIICNMGSPLVTAFADENGNNHGSDQSQNYIVCDNSWKIPYECQYMSGNTDVDIQMAAGRTIDLYSWDSTGYQFADKAPVIADVTENNKNYSYTYDHVDIVLADGTKTTAETLYWKLSSDWPQNITYILDGKELNTGISSITFVYNKYEIETVTGGCTFYDYTVKPSWDETNEKKNSINANENYSDPSSTENRIGVGNAASDQVYNTQKYTATVAGNTDNTLVSKKLANTSYSMNANNYYRPSDQAARATGSVSPGIIKGLDAQDYSKVEFNFDEPGLFSSESKAGKAIINDYALQFKKTGYSYELTAVNDKDGKCVEDNMEDFFPLDGVDDGISKVNENSGHNYYFGLRYDVSFYVGDYNGPLVYSFTGDDDMWVFLDGELVLDIGGIHDALDGEVDLKKVGPIARELTENGAIDGNKDHTLTVLYMERGAWASTCKMNFILPNVSIDETQSGTMNFRKADQNDDVVLNAEFTLVNDSNPSEAVTAKSTGDENGSGNVTFTDLAAGIYTLTETSIPEGYSKAANEPDQYKVVVETDKKNKTTTATMYGTSTDGSIDRNNVISVTRTAADGAVSTELKKSVINHNDNAGGMGNLLTGKTATLENWDDRTYTINLTASSTAVESHTTDPVEVVLMLDTSGSMLFPSELQELKKCRINSDNLEPQKTYYAIKDETATATVYRIFYKNGAWRYIDASFSGDGTVVQNGKLFNKADSYQIYTAKDETQRLEYLKEAALQFVKSLKEASPDSKVALITFNASASTKNGGDFYALDDEKKYAELVNCINGLSTDGGTHQDLALQAAQTVFKDKDHSNQNMSRYAILMTDGAPNGTDWDAISKEAADLKKNYNATLMTAGVCVKNITNAVSNLQSIASSDSKGVSYYYDASSGNEIGTAFAGMFQVINKELPVDGVTVRDYIDPKFQLLDDGGSVIKTDNDKLLDGTLTVSGGKVGYDVEKGFYVEWTDQKVIHATSDGAGWSKVLHVKAADTFIGGNDVATNGKDSYVSVGNVSRPLPLPKVNVKAVIEADDLSDVVFYGDNQYSALDASVVIKNALAEKYTKWIDRDNKPVAADDFTITAWYSEPIENGVPNESARIYDLAKAVEGLEQDTVYYAAIEYTGEGDATEESKANTTIKVDDTNAVTYIADAKTTSSFTIQIVKGQLDIVKTIDQYYTDNDMIKANQTFVFRIDQYAVKLDDNGNQCAGEYPVAAFYQTISFDAQGAVIKDGKSDSATASIYNLKKGFYTITEETEWTPKYSLKSVQDNYDGNNTSVNEADNQKEGVQLFIGQKTADQYAQNDARPVFYGLWCDRYHTIAAGAKDTTSRTEFVNKVDENWKWLSDVASAVNKFLSKR